MPRFRTYSNGDRVGWWRRNFQFALALVVCSYLVIVVANFELLVSARRCETNILGLLGGRTGRRLNGTSAKANVGRPKETDKMPNDHAEMQR